MRTGLWALGFGLWPERVTARISLADLGSRITNVASLSRFTSHLSRAALTLAVLTLAGCGNIEPWVKPYERAAFADPIMSPDPNPVSSAYTHHVYEAREGARGAMGSAGGGCGCN